MNASDWLRARDEARDQTFPCTKDDCERVLMSERARAIHEQGHGEMLTDDRRLLAYIARAYVREGLNPREWAQGATLQLGAALPRPRGAGPGVRGRYRPTLDRLIRAGYVEERRVRTVAHDKPGRPQVFVRLTEQGWMASGVTS